MNQEFYQKFDLKKWSKIKFMYQKKLQVFSNCYVAEFEPEKMNSNASVINVMKQIH